MKRSFMRSRNDTKLCLAAGPYLRRPPHTARQMVTDRSHYYGIGAIIRSILRLGAIGTEHEFPGTNDRRQ